MYMYVYVYALYDMNMQLYIIYVYTYKQYYYMYKSVYGPVASSLFLYMKYSHLKLGLVAPENYTH